ncbi:hypothetical protein YC2023_066613 [Brassica napus]
MISPAHDIFISGQVWNNIRISKPTWSVPNILSHRTALPRHSLTSWLFVLNGNPTLDRLHSWGYDIGKTCILYGLHEETRNYLFLDCHYSLYIWKDLMVKLGIFNAPHSWPTLIQWLISNSGSTTLKQGAIHVIWDGRNSRYHDGITMPPHKTFNSLVSLLRNKATALVNLRRCTGAPPQQFWSGD